MLQVSRMVVALVLARLLAPHDWGLAAMVLVFSGFVVVFTDSALGTALIQRRDLREEDRSTVFWTERGDRARCSCSAASRSPGRSPRFYGEPEVRPLFAALSVGFFVSSLGTTQTALLAPRDAVPRARAPPDGRDGWSAPSSASRSRSPTTAPGRSSASSSPRPRCRRVLLWFAHAVAALVDVLGRQPPPPRRLRGQRLRREPPLPGRPEPQQPADRPLPRRRVASARTRSRRT